MRLLAPAAAAIRSTRAPPMPCAANSFFAASRMRIRMLSGSRCHLRGRFALANRMTCRSKTRPDVARDRCFENEGCSERHVETRVAFRGGHRYDCPPARVDPAVPPIISDPYFYCAAIPAVIFLGLAKGGFSGVGTAATPLLALYHPPLEAAALLLPILVSQDLISIYVYRRDWDASNLKILLPGAVVGMAFGWLIASHVSDNAVRLAVGVIGVAFVANLWLRRTVVEPHRMS